MANGMVRHSICLRPQANMYRILDREWFGLSDTLVEKDVKVEPLIVSAINVNYEMKPEKEILLFKKLASEIATDSVTKCSYSGIVDSNCLNLIAAKYVVEAAILRNVQYGIIDEDETIDFINLANDMRENMELRKRQEEERRIRERQAYEEQVAQHRRDYEERTKNEPKNEEERQARIKTSFDLLYSCISAAEKKECQENGTITIRNIYGKFVIPTKAHGMVKQYDNETNKFMQAHCIVFNDYSIPVGDELLMKTVLLKTDPERFIKTSNKFNREF